MAEDRAAADPRPRPVLLDRDAAEVAADVDQDAVGLPLPVEAGAAAAEDDRDAALAAEGEDLGDVIGVVRHHHRPRQQPVGAGVGGVADDVAGPREDAVGAEQRLQLAPQRLRDAAGQRVGGGVDRGHQNKDIPGATGTSTSSGSEEASAACRAPLTASRSAARWALTP